MLLLLWCIKFQGNSATLQARIEEKRYTALRDEFDDYKAKQHPINEDVPKASPPLTPEPAKETPLLQPVPESCWKERVGCP